MWIAVECRENIVYRADKKFLFKVCFSVSFYPPNVGYIGI